MRPSLIPIVKFLCILLLAAAAGAAVLAILCQTLSGWRGNAVPARDRDALAVPGRVTLVVHGVSDDGAVLSGRIKEAVAAAPAAAARPEVYLFRWTQPDGAPPALGHARNSLKGIEAPFLERRENQPAYQVAVAGRLRDFLVAARALYREYGVDGRIDVVAHSQGTLITLEALDQGGEADNVVFMGSPLSYTCDRQDDVIGALPHVHGVLYNYYSPSGARPPHGQGYTALVPGAAARLAGGGPAEGQGRPGAAERPRPHQLLHRGRHPHELPGQAHRGGRPGVPIACGRGAGVHAEVGRADRERRTDRAAMSSITPARWNLTLTRSASEG